MKSREPNKISKYLRNRVNDPRRMKQLGIHRLPKPKRQIVMATALGNIRPRDTISDITGARRRIFQPRNKVGDGLATPRGTEQRFPHHRTKKKGSKAITIDSSILACFEEFPCRIPRQRSCFISYHRHMFQAPIYIRSRCFAQVESVKKSKRVNARREE